MRTELEAFDWIRPTWSDAKLVAASPFRYDQHPSFVVYLDSGGWHDSGASDPNWTSGNFVTLLAFLQRVSYEEAEEYLELKYGDQAKSSGDITLTVPKLLRTREKPRRINSSILESYKFRSDYLGSRGISEAAQRLAQIGYDKRSRAVTIPWFNPDGTLGNVKYRKVDAKIFWYAKDARPIREMLYGIHIAYQQRLRKAAIVEAEVDALTFMTHGIFAVATGGTAITDEKIALLKRSPIEELTIFRDNDDAGRLWQRRIISELRGHMRISLGQVTREYKDVNAAVVVGYNPKDFRSRRVT